MEPSWTTLSALDGNDVFDSGRDTTKYRVLGQIGKEGDEKIYTEVARLEAFEMLSPQPFLIKGGKKNYPIQVRYLGKADEL